MKEQTPRWLILAVFYVLLCLYSRDYNNVSGLWAVLQKIEMSVWLKMSNCAWLAVTSCKWAEILIKSTGSSLYNGVFTLLSTSLSGRPVYRHERYPLFLYYSQQVNCSAGAWIVADGFSTASSTTMFAVDSATDPMLISPDTTWMVYDRTADQFSPDSRLSLACYTVSQWRKTAVGRPSWQLITNWLATDVTAATAVCTITLKSINISPCWLS